MELLHRYPYLLLTAILFGLLFLGLASSAERRRTTLLAAALSGPYALASVLFVPEYWAPARIACFFAGPEDFVFSFANGGIVWLVATWPSRNRIQVHLDARRATARYIVCSTAGLLVALLLWASGVGIMAASLMSMGLLGVVLLRFYWRWWTIPVVGGIGFSLLYFGLIRSVFAVYPHFLAQWNSDNLWGPSVRLVPIEEILWALAFGAAFPLLMLYTFGVTDRGMHGVTVYDSQSGQLTVGRRPMTSLGRDFGEFKNVVRVHVEEHLRERFARYSPSEVRRVGEYAAMGAGHRWRAMAVVSAGRIFREEPLDVCLSPACAVELVHAATLILDDLPSMDDARVRRGKPCAHLVFPAWAVDMAPAFLVNTAYELILDNPGVSPRRRVLASLVCSGAGQHLCAGQQMDLSERRSAMDEKQLVECYRLKSGALYAASTQAGGIVCGADEHDAGRLHKCGMNLGVAYQFLDDIADVVAGVDEVGKQSGMDAGKRTAVDFFGVEGTRRKARGFQEEALSYLSSYGAEAQMLRELVLRAVWLDACYA